MHTLSEGCNDCLRGDMIESSLKGGAGGGVREEDRQELLIEVIIVSNKRDNLKT